MRILVMELEAKQILNTGAFMAILAHSGAEAERKGNTIKVYAEILKE